MIKGKVSQTIEDIKSSKSGTTIITSSGSTSVGYSTSGSSANILIPTVIVKGCEQAQHQLNIGKDGNVERPHSFSEDLSLLKQSHLNLTSGSSKQKRHNKTDEWDIDVDAEILLDLELEQSRIKRGFANLKSKVKSKQQSSGTLGGSNSSSNLHSLKKDISPSRSVGSSSSSTSFRQSFMRRRRNKDNETADSVNNAAPNGTNSPIRAPLTAAAAVAGATVDIAAAVPVVVSGKLDKRSRHNKEMEIESAVEMLEETIPSPENSTISGDRNYEKLTQNINEEFFIPPYLSEESFVSNEDTETHSGVNVNFSEDYKYMTESLPRRLYNLLRSVPSYSLIAFVVVLILPIHDFIRGILACLLFVATMDGFIDFLRTILDNFLLHYKPERTNFKMPDYRKMPVCAVPSIEENETLKEYEDWLNEIDDYDPEHFQMSLTSSVYVKLEGSVLHVSSTSARIPKRMMWNEKPINLKSITFHSHRTYNLAGCRIDLLPLGLARKRHFNRKYPIQLIVKSSEYTFTNLEEAKNKKTKHEKAGKRDQLEVKYSGHSIQDGKTTESGDIDFGDTLLNADFQKLQNEINPDDELKKMTMLSGDEVRILLFARADRQKEDWFRHFIAARDGNVTDKDLHLPSVKFVDDSYLQAAARKASEISTTESVDLLLTLDTEEAPSTSTKDVKEDSEDKLNEMELEDEFIDLSKDVDTIDGLIMTKCAARSDPNYICFMSLYQKACNQTRIPVYKERLKNTKDRVKRRKRSVRTQNELWKSIDESLFLGPSGSVVWANVLMGRMLYSVLNNEYIIERIKEFFQKKINAIKLPGFMEDVTITNIDLGNKPPLIHRVSQPLINERGVWVDADITYDGFCHVTVTTKLNLLRLKRPAPISVRSQGDTVSLPAENLLRDESSNTSSDGRFGLPSASIYDSDAESSGSSGSSDGEVIVSCQSSLENTAVEGPSTTPGNARRIFKFVDRLAASNLFHYATEISYVQKAMENMSTTITLGIDIKGLVARGTINMPPPPSDRIWLGFRAPPRLWLTARPTVGDKSMDWSIVTNVIEGKLCEAVSKYLVVPNMVDVTVSFIGKCATEL